jgi:magnesium-transporting ATPase (P-type)
MKKTVQRLIGSHKFPIIIMILFIVVHFISYRKENIIEKIATLNLKVWTIILTIICIMIVFFYNGNPEDFIYFKF